MVSWQPEKFQESHSSLVTDVAERSRKVRFKKNPMDITTKYGKY